MAQAALRGIPQTFTIPTTMTELTWAQGRPDLISIQATTQIVYVSIGTGLDGGTLGTHYWPIPAGSTHPFDLSNTKAPIALSAASSSAVHVWAS